MLISSLSNSQQTISDDDEIDYSVKPDFYDPDHDYKDELWLEKKRQGRSTDAALGCPGCFTTLCLECQRKTNAHRFLQLPQQSNEFSADIGSFRVDTKSTLTQYRAI